MAESTFFCGLRLLFQKIIVPLHSQMSRKVSGQIPEWPNGADCKSAVFRLRWFESIFAHKKGEHRSPFLLLVQLRSQTNQVNLYFVTYTNFSGFRHLVRRCLGSE